MKVSVALCLALGLAVAVAAEPLMLQPAQNIHAGGAPLNPGGQAIPCVVDWNGDGLPDLVVGYQPAFKVAVYLNSGSTTQPLFAGFTNVQAGGVDIYHWSAGCGSPAPWVCDYDGDGKRDLLVGAGADGKVWFYRNTNTDANPMLTSGVTLLKSGSELNVGARATPYVHDWDEDGLPDLLCGDANGYVHLFKNTGTRQSPVYLKDVLILAGGSALNLSYRSVVRVCDWDGDGVKDLLGSGSDNAAWCRNTGDNSSPVLSSPTRLQSPVSGVGLANIDTGYRMRLGVVDWNQDGLPDLLIGNWDGYIYFYESYRFLLTGWSLRAGNQGVLEWNSAPFLKYNLLAGSTVNDLEGVVATNLPSGGRVTRWTNSLAGDCQFLRVQLAQ